MEPNFRWTDTGKRVILTFNVAQAVKKSDLEVNITPNTIKIALTEAGVTQTVLEVGIWVFDFFLTV